MKDNWLWDRKTKDTDARKVLKKPDTGSFIATAALLLSRKNEPNEVFRHYLDPVIFCQRWGAIKRRMRQDKWGEGRIIFWQAVYEKLMDKYRKKGIIFRKEVYIKEPLCEFAGKKVATIRREEGLSQKELAKRIGVSQQLISRIEKGGENVSLGTLSNIVRALHKRVEINFVE